jgi:hypothetical protein
VGDGGAGQTARQTYWDELVILKVVGCYVRRYRDEQAWWMIRIGLFKAVVTSATIGAWVIRKDYAFVWGILIGATQISYAAKDYLPQRKHGKNASEFVGIIENAIIDARFEWFAIFHGQYEAMEIMNRWRPLAKLLNEAEGKYFPDGIPANPGPQRLAEAEASAYFPTLYGVGSSENG